MFRVTKLLEVDLRLEVRYINFNFIYSSSVPTGSVKSLTSRVRYFIFCKPCGLCCNSLNLPLSHKSGRSQYGHEWPCLYFNTSTFTKSWIWPMGNSLLIPALHMAIFSAILQIMSSSLIAPQYALGRSSASRPQWCSVSISAKGE